MSISLEQGANLERKAIRAKVRREIKENPDNFALQRILGFIDSRTKRFNAEAGGLQSRKLKSKGKSK